MSVILQGYGRKNLIVTHGYGLWGIVERVVHKVFEAVSRITREITLESRIIK